MQRLGCGLAAAAVLLGAVARADERTLAGGGGYRALLFLPAGYAERPRWPLLLYLHGAAERGDELERVAATGPPKEIRAGRTLPLVVVAPLLPADQRWRLTVFPAAGHDAWTAAYAKPDLYEWLLAQRRAPVP